LFEDEDEDSEGLLFFIVLSFDSVSEKEETDFNADFKFFGSAAGTDFSIGFFTTGCLIVGI
jgi:hypothetical protein